MNVKLSREELIELTRRIIEVDFDSEDEVHDAVEIVKANVPDPKVTDYIFWPDPIDKVVDPEEVVDRALRYKPAAETDEGNECSETED
jgi:hypothetical protein